MRRTQGFTLVEMMIVVAIIIILSMIAMNVYSRMSARARVTEVHAVLADIRAKEEAYRAEYGSYLSASTSETNLYPALIGGSEPLSKNWDPAINTPYYYLGVKPPSQQVFCGYAVIAAPAGSWGSAGAYLRSTLANTVPTVHWWGATAMCDNDGIPGSLGSATNASFATTSLSTRVREDNPTR